MDWFEGKNISRIMLAQRDIESMDAEKLSDMTEYKAVCFGDVCGVAWKPSIDECDIDDSPE